MAPYSLVHRPAAPNSRIVSRVWRVLSLSRFMSDQRVIKRYANRKLYDTQHSKYVTLEQIAEMIRNGDDVCIIDNKSKEDLTSVTLAQIIFEEEKKQNSFLPLQAMRNIIQNGGGSIQSFVSKAQERVTGILPRKGREDGEEGELDEDEPTLEVDDSGEEVDEVGRRWHIRELREWLTSSQRAIDEWQRKVDEGIRNVARGISPFASVTKDVELLSTRIAELEAKLRRLDAGDPAEIEAAEQAASETSQG